MLAFERCFPMFHFCSIILQWSCCSFSSNGQDLGFFTVTSKKEKEIREISFIRLPFSYLLVLPPRLSVCLWKAKSIKMIRAGISQMCTLKPWSSNAVQEIFFWPFQIASNCLGNFSVTRGNKVQSVLLAGFKFSSSKSQTYLFFASWLWHPFSTEIHTSNLLFFSLGFTKGLYCAIYNPLLFVPSKTKY